MKELKANSLYKILIEINTNEKLEYDLETVDGIEMVMHHFFSVSIQNENYKITNKDIIIYLDLLAKNEEISDEAKFELYVSAMYYFYALTAFADVYSMGEKARSIPRNFELREGFDRIAFLKMLAIAANYIKEDAKKIYNYSMGVIFLHEQAKKISPLNTDEVLVLNYIACKAAFSLQNHNASIKYGLAYSDGLNDNLSKHKMKKETTITVYLNLTLSNFYLKDFRKAFYYSQLLLKYTPFNSIPPEYQRILALIAGRAKKYKESVMYAETALESFSKDEDKEVLYQTILPSYFKSENYEGILKHVPEFLKICRDENALFTAFACWVKAASALKNINALKQIADSSEKFINILGYKFVSKVLAEISKIENELEEELEQKQIEERSIKKEIKKQKKLEKEKITAELKKIKPEKIVNEIKVEEKAVEPKEKVEEKQPGQKLDSKEKIEVKLEKKPLIQPIKDEKNKKEKTTEQTDKTTKAMPFFAKTQPVFSKIGDRSSLMQLKADFLPKNNGIFCCLEFTKDIEVFQKSQPGAFLKLYSQIEESTVCLARNDQGIKYIAVEINGIQYDWEAKIKSKHDGEGDWRILGRAEQEKNKDGKIITRIVFDMPMDHKTFQNRIKKGNAPLLGQVIDSQQNQAKNILKK